MQIKIDKRDRSVLFRDRLTQAMTRKNMSKSALARMTGVDRSTVGQLLGSEAARLPNAQLAADAAQALGVSVDWLLGLTDRPERPGDLIAAAVEMTEAERNTVDAQVLGWHREAAGYKIRHVPATLPDLLKTEAVKDWEYEAFLGRSPELGSGSLDAESHWLTSGASDYEIALPLHELSAFAEGSGYYAGLPAAVRKAQLDHLADSCDTLYPQLRLFPFDARRAFSAPMTCFGPLLAVVYVGRFYLAFREGERVRSMIRHFDWLVRESAIDARQVGGYLRTLSASVS
jgi:transcriptional regulator with XRE-family HTH domain